MAEIDAKYYGKKKSSTFYVAAVFLLLVICATGGLYFYKSQLEVQKTELDEKINTLSASVESIKNNPDIQTYSIYEVNKDFFTTLGEYSKIPTFVNHLKKYFAKYDIEAEGFNYDKGVVSINLSSSTNERGYSYQKIVTFIREYNENEAARFTPELVSSFIGHDRINYIWEFTLKPSK